MDALFVAFLITSTAVVSVGLGILGAYCALSAVLAALNPAQPRQSLATLLPRQSQVSGD